MNYNHPHIGYPLYFACKQNNEKLVKLLLDYGADPFIMENEDHEDFSYFIYIAIYDGNNLFLKTCLELGYDPNYLNVNITDDTPLIISIKRSNIEAMKLLIKYGAKINIVNDLNNFMTPLSIATKRYGENSNYVKILKENNALNLKYKFSVKTYGSSTTNRLRVREKPTLDADVVGHLMEGDIIEMIEVTPLAYTIDDMLFPWVRIKNNEISGWVFAGYIKLHTDNYGA